MYRRKKSSKRSNRLFKNNFGIAVGPNDPAAVCRMKEQKFIVAGKWRTSSEQSKVLNPFDGTAVALQHQALQDDCNEAIESARSAFSVTSNYSGFERAEILRSVAQQLRERKEECASLITAEAGKPILFSRIEVDRAVSTFELAAEEAVRIHGEALALDGTASTKGKQGIVRKFPIGIIVCISPFNFPLNLVAHKIAPAIASGNTFILKPPPQAPLTSMLLGEMLLKSGLEKSAINILPTSNERAESLVTDPRIDMLSFTGSAHVGWMLKSKAGKKKTLLELGGNAAAIVDATADINHSVARCTVGAFGYSGQVCIKVQRIIIADTVYDLFRERLITAARQVAVGNPADEKTITGPMISEHEALRVESWVNEARQMGAAILTGGMRDGSFYAPTVIERVTPEMKVCSEEIFGPVVTLERSSSVDEAIEMVNGSKYGLQAGIFSNDFAAIQHAYRNLQVGALIVNDYPTFRVDSMPYGGVKESGFGREGVRYAMEEMMEKRLLVY